MWFAADNLVLDVAQAACVALPAAGVPAWLARFRGGAWALVLPLSIAVVIAAIDLTSVSADVLTWVALLLVPAGCALALGWAAHGARPWLALGAAPLLALAWNDQGGRAGQLATIALIAGSCVTLGRLLAAAAPLWLLEVGVVVMAITDSILVFGNELQAPNAVLVAASPGAGLPQLQSASYGLAGMGYGDFFAAAVVGGILAARRRDQLVPALGLIAVSLAWEQLFLVVDTIPATVPPAIVLVLTEVLARVRAARATAAR